MRQIKKRLQRYGKLVREKDQLIDQKAAVEAVMYSPKAQRLTGMPSGPSDGDAVSEMVGRRIELEDLICAKIAEIYAEQLAIEKLIEPLDPTARMLIRYRYIDCLTWETVYVKMNYSRGQTHNIHSRALAELEGPES